MNSKKLRSDRLEQFQTLVKRNLLIPNTAEEDEKRWNLHYYCLLAYGLCTFLIRNDIFY